MKPKIMVLWHEPSNMMATCEITDASLPLILVCDEEYKGINPFFAHPLQFLIKYYGWKKLGEL